MFIDISRRPALGRVIGRAVAATVAVAAAGVALPAAPASAATPAVVVTTTATNPTTGVTLKVDGTGFTGQTNPGDDGVYVGLAPAGGLPDVSTLGGMDSFAASAWVRSSQMPGGTFSVSVTAPPSKLDRTKSYAIYTWRAHTHSTTTQDTQTPVTIDWAALKAPSSLAVTWEKKPTVAGKKGTLSVAASGSGTPTGEVVVTLARKGSSKTKTVKTALAAGKAVAKLPKLTQGRWTLTIAYAGDTSNQGSQTTTSVRVKPRPEKK
jgi:hypothetical protein